MNTLLNDNDPRACAWLRELIAAGHLPPADISSQSITDLQAHELSRYTNVHLFAGIGGWPLALQLAHWPSSIPVWTGSCPCQPFSCAGRGGGTTDPRHLWPRMLRLISEHRPPVVFGEQVASKAGREWLAGVRADLEALGYAVGAADLCAAGVGAPHIRQRLYWSAWLDHPTSPRHASARSGQPGESEWRGSVLGVGCEDGGLELPPCNGRQQRGAEPSGRSIEPRCELGAVADVISPGLEIGRLQTARGECAPLEQSCPNFWHDSELIPCADGKARRIEPGSFPLAHGLPARMGRLRGYGNAIVPQIAAVFVSAFMEATDITPEATL